MDEQSIFGQMAAPASEPPPPPPPATASAPILSPEYGLSELPEAPEVPQRSSKLPWIAAMLGTLILLGGGSLLAASAFAAEGGAETPEEAVDALLAAADAEDFITIGELLEPGERRTIVEPTITELLPELVRLGVFEDSLDPGDVEGVDFEFIDVTYRVETPPNAGDFVHVYFTGGEVASEFDAAVFPFTDALRREMGDELESQPRTVETIEETDTPMVLVERNGRWYLSGMFTIAENARLFADQPLPSAAEAPPALGSESPEAAVENMVAAIEDLDLAAMIGRMDPEEMAVLYRYAPLFLDEGQEELDELVAEMEEERIRWNFSEFDLESSTDGDDGVVEIRGFTFDFVAPDVDISFTYGRERLSGSLRVGDDGSGTLSATMTQWDIEGIVDGETIDIEITIDPDTYTVRGSGVVQGESGEAEVVLDPEGVCSEYFVTASDGTEESGCLEAEDGMGLGGVGIIEQYVAFFDEWEDEFPGISMAVHRTNDEWYISPIGTMFDGYLALLSRLDENDFDGIGNSTGVVGSFGPAGALAELGEEIDRSINNNGGTTAEAAFEDIEVIEAEEEGMQPEIAEPPFPSEPVVEDAFKFTVEPGAVMTITDAISFGGYDTATAAFDAGDRVVITVQASEGSFLDSLLIVTGPNGRVVAENDDADQAAGLRNVFDSQVMLDVAETGAYTIEVHAFGDLGEGEYQLTVELP